MPKIDVKHILALLCIFQLMKITFYTIEEIFGRSSKCYRGYIEHLSVQVSYYKIIPIKKILINRIVPLKKKPVKNGE